MTSVKKYIKANYELLLCILLLFVILIFAINPTPYIASSLSGLTVFAKIVLPSLFCFFFLTKIFMSIKSSGKLFSPLGKVFGKIYNVSSHSGYIFSMSIISGYPIGAKLIKEFYENGEIDKNDATKMLAFCSTSGPMFIMGSLPSIVHTSDISLVILISHILSALINGLIFSKVIDRKNSKNNAKNAKNSAFLSKNCVKNINLSNNGIKRVNINDIMYDTILSCFMVGGFITLCFTAIEFLGNNIIFARLKSIGQVGEVAFGIISGIIEMTSGCIAIGEMALGKMMMTAIITGLVTFGGLSIHLQSNIFLSKVGIKYGYFLLIKTTQTIIAVCFSVILCILF